MRLWNHKHALVAGALALISAGSPAFAATPTQGSLGGTSTGQIGISATIPASVQITKLSDLSFGNLDPTTATQLTENPCVWSNTATTGVRFRAGRLVRVRQLQPGDPTIWFPYSAKRVQYLAAGSGGEEGTVVGVVRVNYSYPSREPLCFPYAPPRSTVQVYPRRYYISRDFLRQFTG